MATVLVTGGAGFIGSHLVDALASAGDAVRVLDDFSSGRRPNLAAAAGRIELRAGSVLDRAQVAAAVDGVEAVYHLAALPSVARSLEDPVATHEACATGTLVVLEAARRAGVARFVYAASSSAYGGTHAGGENGGDRATVRRCREDDTARPLSPYAAAKFAGEEYSRLWAQLFGLATVRLRFFNVYGPRQRAGSPYAGVVPRFIEGLLADGGVTIHGDGLQSRDFTYVADAVSALRQAAAAPAERVAGQVYNVAGGRSVSLRDLLAELERIVGRKAAIRSGPARPGDVRHSAADLTRAQRDLGWRPQVALREGLERTVAAFTAEAASASRLEQGGSP